jgi:acetyltransferase-like isoleucine patch superfamily enzyme
VQSAKTVNGSISLGDNGRASLLETVNGHVTIASRAVVSGDAMTVNGRVRVGEDASVQGTAKTVNGELRLAPRAKVGHLSTVLGDITLQDNARVERGILVSRPKGTNSNWPDSPPKITIGPGAEVNGELIFEHPVKLRVHSTAKIGTVKGAEVERY